MQISVMPYYTSVIYVKGVSQSFAKIWWKAMWSSFLIKWCTTQNATTTSSTFQLFVELVPHITIIIIFSTRRKRDKKFLACPASSIKYSVCVLRVVHKYENGISRCLFVYFFFGLLDAKSMHTSYCEALKNVCWYVTHISLLCSMHVASINPFVRLGLPTWESTSLHCLNPVLVFLFAFLFASVFALILLLRYDFNSNKKVVTVWMDNRNHT